MKCAGTMSGPCPGDKSGLGVKKDADGKYRCDECKNATSTECVGTENGPCPDKKTGLGVRKYGEEWKCEKCAKSTNANTTRINELLCFMSNYAAYDENTIAKLCKDFYTENEIKIAKQTLIESFRGDRNKIVPRTDGGCEYINILLTIRTLVTDSSSDLPQFVAQDLTRLPTVTQDNIDINSLFRDLQLVRNKVNALSRNTDLQFSQVKRDIQRVSASVSRPPQEAPPSNDEDADVHDDAPLNDDPPDGGVTPSATRTAWSDDAPDDAESDDNNNNPWQEVTRKPRRRRTDQNSTKSRGSNTRVVGTGDSRAGLTASCYEPPVSLFISFLPPETTPKQLENYIKRNVGCEKVEVEKLEHRYYDDFAAFKVTTKKKFIDYLRDPTIWPKNVIVDYYKSPRRRPDNQNRQYGRQNGYANNQNRRQYNAPHDSRDGHSAYRSSRNYYQRSTDYANQYHNER